MIHVSIAGCSDRVGDGFVRKKGSQRLQWVDLLDVYYDSYKSAHNPEQMIVHPAASAAGAVRVALRARGRDNGKVGDTHVCVQLP